MNVNKTMQKEKVNKTMQEERESKQNYVGRKRK